MANYIDLLSKYFGSYVALPFPGSRAEKVRVDILEGYNSQVYDQKQPAKFSALGLPIFMPCTIDGWELPNEPLIEIGGGKSIVRTELAGYAGSFKENMGLNDYEIIIRGVAINEESDDYPEDLVRKLRAIYEKKESVTITSPLLGIFNINLIAIERLRLPANEGELNAQPFEIQCYSDNDIELILKDGVF